MTLKIKVVGNSIPFSRVQLRDKPLRPLTKQIIHPINGLDTETLDGYARLLSDHEGNYILTHDINEILAYMTHRRFRSAHNFFFNLRFDMNAIIKYLPRKNLVDMWKKGRTQYKGYRLKYIPKKLFSITRSKHVHKYYDIAQFYETSLDEASRDYLDQKKNPDNIDRKKLGTSARYWRKHMVNIIKYCTLDAKLARQLGELLQNTLINKIKLTPQGYISKAGVSKEYVRKNTVVPDIRKIDYKVLKMAFNAYHGGRFEILLKGWLDICTLIDLNSAYPSIIRNLVDVTRGKWKPVRNLHEEAIYGYYLVKVATRYQDICPIAYQHKGLVTCFPVIEFTTFLTKNELLNYDKAIHHNIITGWEYYDNDPKYPFRKIIDRLYHNKQITPKDHYEYKLYKKIMNSIYGSFYEKIKIGDIWRAGKLFNPIYATEITADTRIKCYNESLKYPKKVAGFATDSLLLQGKHDMPESKMLGEWSLDRVSDTTILRSGIYKMGDKVKKRGMAKTEKLKTEYGEFDTIFDYLREKPALTQYPININRPVNFVEALLHSKKRTKADINVFIDHNYTIDINRDHKRLWSDTFECGGELLEKKIESRPLIIM